MRTRPLPILLKRGLRFFLIGCLLLVVIIQTGTAFASSVAGVGEESQPVFAAEDSVQPAAVPVTILKSGYASPNPFTPDGDGVQDATAISFLLAQNAKVSVDILNYRGVVRNLLADELKDEGLQQPVWTGTNNHGQVLPRGTYKFIVRAVTDSGATQDRTGTVTLSIPLLQVTTPWVSTNPFSPNGDGASDTTAFVYHLNRPAQVTIEVLNWLGPIRTVVYETSRAPGKNMEGWTGTDLLGHPLANGTYSYKIRAKTGGEVAEAVGTLTVQGVVGGGPRWIHTRTSTRELFLMDGPSLLKRYRIAVGTSDHPTPLGNWRITAKKKDPTWYNPNQPWSEDMPPFIGPGADNPLGTRALYLNASGIRIHGTYLRNSIGRAASHGCIRMYREDSEEIFELVPVGTIVRVTN